MVMFYFSLSIYLVGMILIFLYSLAQADLLIYYLRHRQKPRFRKSLTFEKLPSVTIQLPIYNEKYVVKRLITAIAKINYPPHLLEVQILDDSTDETSDLIQKAILQYPDFNFKYLQRVDRKGFKAGALEDGLRKASGEFVAIFDADFVPDPEFLMKILHYFTDEQVGMVQSRWTHLNKNYSILTRLQAFALDAHFVVEQMGRNSQQAFINFNGTAGIWRKSCIEDAGGWSADTLTEDLDLSYRAQQKGWKFVYDVSIESPAELPPVMPAIKSQQFRWTKGGAECAAKHLKNIWSSNLPLKIKLHSTAHLLNSTIFVAVLAVSLSSISIALAIFFGRIQFNYISYSVVFFLGFVIIAGVYYVANLLSEGFSFINTFRFIGELILFLSVSMGLSLHNSIAVIEGWTGKKSAFVRTPKFNIVDQKANVHENVYQQLRVPITTYVELALSIVFGSLVVIAIVTQNLSFLIFHSMLTIGFGCVGVLSFIGYRGK
jgi:cellulose synthase/poly-beta-1,6-N-acetylglucosamine synthase-like glycosyltransferase